METGTLKELKVQPGDVVKCVSWKGIYYTTGLNYPVVEGYGKCGVSIGTDNSGGLWSIVYRAPNKIPCASVSPKHAWDQDKPQPWGEMTDAEKGALLLAYHEGKIIEQYATPRGGLPGGWFARADPAFLRNAAYRVRPKPKREPVHLNPYTMHLSNGHTLSPNEYRITFDLIYGEPDCDSIKMERL